MFHECAGLYWSKARVKVIIFIQQGEKLAADATEKDGWSQIKLVLKVFPWASLVAKVN